MRDRAQPPASRMAGSGGRHQLTFGRGSPAERLHSLYLRRIPFQPRATLEGYASLLFAHVLEHMDLGEASDLVAEYLPYLRSGGRVIVIVPQEAGFKSDPTHVALVDLDEVAWIEAARGLIRERDYSFPFPRFVGRFFPHNETVVISRKT